MTVKTEKERKDFLASLGLNPDAPALVSEVAPVAPARAHRGTATSADEDCVRRTTPAADIVFDPSLLSDFSSLDGANMSAASRHLFDLYKSPHKDKERHALLHRRIGEFIQQVRRSRQTGGLVPAEGTTEKVKATREQRDIAALLAAKGLTAADLAALLAKEA